MHSLDHPRLLVVDDENELSLMIADYLGRHGFSVRSAASGGELDARLEEEPADLLILDVNMPGEDGFSIARRIRATSDVPILMLTSVTDVVDRVLALELGVDDYLTKPFDLRELRARARAILRRALPPEPAAESDGKTKASHRVRFGSVVLDTEAHCLFRSNGEQLALTAMEFDLLWVFAQNPNRVLSRDRLLDLANSSDRDPFDRSIDVRITRLRKKVEVDPDNPMVIRTVRGVGYMFVPAASEAS